MIESDERNLVSRLPGAQTSGELAAKYEGMASPIACDHAKESRSFLNGTEVRKVLRKEVHLPGQLTWPKVVVVLQERFSQTVDQ